MFPISKSVASCTGDRVQIVARHEDLFGIYVYESGGSSAAVGLDRKALNELISELLELSGEIADTAEPKQDQSKPKAAPAPKPAPKKKAAKGK